MPDLSNCDRFDPLRAVKPSHAHAAGRGLPAHHVHRIIGRINRHSLPRRELVRRGLLANEGCRAVPLGHHAILARGRPVSMAARLNVIPALTAAAAVLGGSGVLGGFGGDGIIPQPLPHGIDGCAALSCPPGIVLPEPASVAILVSAVILFFMFLFRAGNGSAGQHAEGAG